MREIKFRAWDGLKMYQSHSIDEDGAMCAYGDFVNEVESPERKSTQMQYTGLKDKNGKEIYEGDIVRLSGWNPEVCEVVFDRGGFCFRFKPDDTYYPDGKYLEDGEVIGNIYENPKLVTLI